MDHEKLMRIQKKLAKYGTILRYFSFVILTFLFLQIEAFDITSSSLLPKLTLFAGLLQIILFLIFLRIEEENMINLTSCLKKHILEDRRITFKMALPPILLILSNELLKISSDILPKEYKEAKAFFIVGVALFNFLLLGKKFSLTQMLSTIFIAFGLTNFQNNTSLSIFTFSSLSTENSIYGYLSILAAICCYGLSFSILESILKFGEVSLWIRGIQLNLLNVPILLLITITNHFILEPQRGFFDNFNIIAWFFIIFLVSCSMMELFVLKIADCMFRMISLSLATMLISILQYPLSFETVNSPVKIGCGLILAGSFLYSATDLLNSSSNGENLKQKKILRETSYSVPMKLYHSVPTVSYNVEDLK